MAYDTDDKAAGERERERDIWLSPRKVIDWCRWLILTIADADGR